MSDETLSKAELTLIDKIIGSLGLSSLHNLLWKKVEQAFRFTFKNTQVNYGFTHATPDPLALKYLEERVFILSDKTRDRLTGDLRWELLEGIRNTESISDIKKRLEPIFTRMHDYEIERIARTETLNAMNAGRLEAYEASEVTHYKMWRAAINNKRTAEDSRRLHGQIQELSDPFVDPKTGEGVMHPPNRPNCRCTMIPLRKLPENVVYKSGQMYAADEMVGKIEIDITSLNKTEKRIWVKPTSKRKGHYRKVKRAKKVEEKISEQIDFISNLKSLGESNEDFVERGGWNTGISEHFRLVNDNANIFMEENKIYGMAELSDFSGDILRIRLLEVNPDMRRKGYGVKLMKNITKKALANKVETISLNSANENSDKFYNAIGMTAIKQYSGRNSYVGDQKWMKRFMESI